MNADQKEKLLNLFVQEHVAVLITQGDQWPTGTMQAFSETPDLDLLFIMRLSSERFENLTRHPKVTVLVDTRDVGKLATFEIARATVQGEAVEVPRESADWETMKALFLKKNPFEAPFFDNDTLRMVRIRPKRISTRTGLKTRSGPRSDTVSRKSRSGSGASLEHRDRALTLSLESRSHTAPRKSLRRTGFTAAPLVYCPPPSFCGPAASLLSTAVLSLLRR